MDSENNRLRLRWKQTKNKKPACCCLPASFTVALAAFADSGAPQRLYEKARTWRELPEAPLIFVPTQVLRLLNADLECVGVPKENREGKLDFHALRGTLLTLGMEAGANPKELRTMARQADPRWTFNTFARKRDPRLAALAQKVGQNGPVFGLESATSVHLTTNAPGFDARRSLPEQALSHAHD